jgi:hypothetical protein
LSGSLANTTPEEFLQWVGPWALEKAAKVIDQTGEFGRPMLFGLAEDGTHHVSMLAFWSYDDHQESMNLLRKVIRSSKMVAVALLSKGRIAHTGEIPVDGMILIKSRRDGVSRMEVYLPQETSGKIVFADEPSEVMEGISGRLTSFWDPPGDEVKEAVSHE